MHLEFEIDGGGDFLKFFLPIQSSVDNIGLDNIRQKYEDGVACKNFRDPGEKMLFLLALAQSSQENYCMKIYLSYGRQSITIRLMARFQLT